MHTAAVNRRRCHVPILPPAIRLLAMKALHGLLIAGHLGYKKTYDHIRSLLSCQPRKPPPRHHSSYLQLFSASRPFGSVGVDIFGSLSCTTHGSCYVVVMVDRFSRWTQFTAVPDITTSTVTDAFINFIVLCRHGCPNHVISDRGSQFTSNLFDA